MARGVRRPLLAGPVMAARGLNPVLAEACVFEEARGDSGRASGGDAGVWRRGGRSRSL